MLVCWLCEMCTWCVPVLLCWYIRHQRYHINSCICCTLWQRRVCSFSFRQYQTWMIVSLGSFSVLFQQVADALAPYFGGSSTSPSVQFVTLQYALYMTAFVCVLGGGAYLATAIYIEGDKQAAKQQTQGIGQGKIYSCLLCCLILFCLLYVVENLNKNSYRKNTFNMNSKHVNTISVEENS